MEGVGGGGVPASSTTSLPLERRGQCVCILTHNISTHTLRARHKINNRMQL
jgi:hypothetical protein